VLRHTLATLAYRAGKVLRDAPPNFAGFQAAPTLRTPAEIVAHMGDLFDWALALADGVPAWHDSKPLAWDEEVARFFAALEKFDRRLASGVKLAVAEEKLFQGPVADALTHTGQIALLRRMARSPVRGENYYRAEIEVGRTGTSQAAPVMEFN
jgi:hypothetical protein